MAPQAQVIADPNQQIGELLLDLAETYRPSPQYWGYKRASRAIRRHPDFLSELSEREILEIPNVGPGTLKIVKEFLETGISVSIDRAIEKSGKEKEIRPRRMLRARVLSGAMVARIPAYVCDGSLIWASHRGRHDDRRFS